jgi:hypothetical protein
MGLFSSVKKVHTVALFDIGSGSIGGALVHYSDDEKIMPTIINSFRTDIVFRQKLDFSEYLSDMIVALENTATGLYKSASGAPDEIVCVLASPWYLSETRLIKTSKATPFIFTKRLADGLLQKELELLSESYQRKYGNSGNKPELLEERILNVSLNGYPIDDPLGKKARSLELTMLISISPQLCLDRIRESLSKTFHHTPVSFSSFMLSSFMAVRDRYVSPDSYLLLDIGGEVTDVAIVSRGILKASLSFPFGKRSFFKYMTSKLDIELRDAQEIFNLYVTNTLSEKRKNALAPLFKSIEQLWCEAFRESISALPYTLSLPGTVFLTADNDIQDWFASVLCNEEYIQSMLVERKCRVVTLSGPEFLNMCSVKNGKCDPFLMIEAIGVARRMEK